MNVKSYFINSGLDSSSIYLKTNNTLPDITDLTKDDEEIKFDTQFLRIFSLLKEIHLMKNQSKKFSLDCFVEAFDNEVSEKDKLILINGIKTIGFNKIRDTFERINSECENYLCNPENLFGILKRHQFSKEVPADDSDMLKQIIQFMHLTLIQLNILQNNKHKRIPERLVAIKTSAYYTIEPLINKVDEIFVKILHRYRKMA